MLVAKIFFKGIELDLSMVVELVNLTHSSPKTHARKA